MSLNYQRALEPVACYDPRIDFDLDDEGAIGDADNSRMYGDKYLVYRGPKNIEYFNFPPNSGDGNAGGATSTDFTYFMPSRETILDRCIYLKAQITVQMTNNVVPAGAILPAVPLNTGKFGLKAFPLHQCIRVLQLQIDGNIYTVDLQQSFRHLVFYSFSEDELKTWSSLCPSLLDNSAVFDDGNSNNVLSAIDSGTAFVPPRGRFSYDSIVQFPGQAIGGNPAAIPASATVVYTVAEPIQLSPLILNAIQQSKSTGLTGMANIKIKITWRSPSDCFYYGFNVQSYALTDPLSTTIAGDNIYMKQNTTVAFAGAPPLPVYTTTVSLPSFTSPQPNLSQYTSSLTIQDTGLILGVLTNNDVSIAPPINSYDFLKYDTYTDSVNIFPDRMRTMQVVTKTYNLSQIPHYVLIAAPLSINNYNYTSFLGHTSATSPPINPIAINTLPDFYYDIYNFNGKLGNRSGLLANAPPEILFEMNRQNGLVFQNYSNSGTKLNSNQVTMRSINAAGTTMTLLAPQGSPLLLQFGKDIGIDDASLSPGCAVNTVFQAILQLNNPYGIASTGSTGGTFDLIIIFIYCGIYTVSTTGSSYVTSPLSREDVLNSDNERVDSDELAMQQGASGGVFVGGKMNFLKKLKGFGKKVFHALKSPTSQRLIREIIDTGDVLGVPGFGAANKAIESVELARDIAKERGHARGSGYGGVLDHSVLSGGTMMGGSVLTAAQLRQRLMKK